MIDLHEHDAMRCRACGREERASEGYPCERCGTFVCQICSMNGVRLCKACDAAVSAEAAPPPSGADVS